MRFPGWFGVVLLMLGGIGCATAELPADREMTVAWKMPVAEVIPSLENHPGVRRLEKAPGESVYFREGDPLWDLSKGLDWQVDLAIPAVGAEKEPSKIKVTGEWTGKFVVWDGRSGMIVARGTPQQIRGLESVLHYDRQPVIFRTLLEVVKTGEGGKEAVPLSLTLTASEGEQASKEEGEFSADVTAGTRWGEWCEIEAAVEWKQGRQKTRVETIAVVRDGKRSCLAQCGSGTRLYATVTRVRPDGTRCVDARSREEEGKIVAWPGGAVDEEPAMMKSSDGGRLIGLIPVSSWEQVIALSAGDGYEVVEAPKGLGGLAGTKLVDLGRDLREKGVSVAFAGYEPFAKTVVIMTEDESQFDLVQVLYEGGGCRVMRPNFWIEGEGIAVACAVDAPAAVCLNPGEERELGFSAKVASATKPGSYELELRQVDQGKEVAVKSELKFLEDGPRVVSGLKDEDGRETKWRVTRMEEK